MKSENIFRKDYLKSQTNVLKTLKNTVLVPW